MRIGVDMAPKHVSPEGGTYSGVMPTSIMV